MKETEYRQYFRKSGLAIENTIKAQIKSRVKRVEKFHGDLDEHYAQDLMASVIEELKYSRDDQRSNQPNPSWIQINGDIYKSLYSYRKAVEWYRNFTNKLTARL